MEENIKLLEILNILGYDNSPLSEYEYTILKEDIIYLYNILYNSNIKEDLINNFFIVKYILKSTSDNDDNKDDNVISLSNNYITLKEKEKIYDNIISNIKLPLDLKEKQEHFVYLQKISNYAQKSKEWFELRNSMITASITAEVLNESKYGCRTEVLLDKLGLLPCKFKENAFVHHGKKYEQIALMIYEYVFNTKIKEFGLIPYNYGNKLTSNVNILGASPDGINSCTTIDGKPNKLIGRLLEIKCPYKRKIINIGNIDGIICPHNYWIQVQVQLACCNSIECDFWQCEIEEIDEYTWLNSNSLHCNSTEEQGINLSIHDYLTRGCIIQLLPIDKKTIPKNDKYEWYSKYIYPNNLMMSNIDYIKWKNYMTINWMNIYFEYSKEYYFDKIIFWRLNTCHNILIKRDDNWFNSKFINFKTFWNELLLYKNNNILAKKLLEDYLKKHKKTALSIFKKQNNVIIDDFLSIS